MDHKAALLTLPPPSDSPETPHSGSTLLSDTKGEDNKEEDNTFMAWDPFGQIGFNVARADVLGLALPPFRAGDHPSISTTRTRYRLRWNQLHVWNDFGTTVSNYWNIQVSQMDQAALVSTQNEIQGRWQSIANNQRILSEDDIKSAIESYPLYHHRSSANGALGAPLPSDEHATADRCTQGAASWGLAGVADFVMHHLDRVTVVMEVKNPWLVTPQEIDEVLNGIILFPPSR
jgi:hypothetical protein